jgi:rifampin ADP-ribosylating transferase
LAGEPNVELFYHGTKAQLKPGDLIAPGHDGPVRIYVVEPTGPIMDDPNLTNTRYPGNPTKSYRSSQPLRVTGEITDWQGHPPETVQAMKARIKGLKPLDD